MTDNEKLAQLLFGHIDKTPEYYEELYPARDLPEGARVTRFAPSPTGFVHLGSLFASLSEMLIAKSTGGLFYLRIEDTDKKREVEDGVTGIVKGLRDFGITFDEGVTGKDSETGDYGPYTQSKRKDIYQCFAKKLVEQGLAYPCFCTEDEIASLRLKQEEMGLDTKGYYGQFAKCRDLSFEEQEERIKNGEEYTLRFRSPGKPDGKVVFEDLIKGKIEMPENVQDIVLLKRDGIPTYHFAHVVDDHLMRSTHIVRGDEWISSVPTHIQLFRACGFKVPKYAHISPIMKEDETTGGKRKLSKRKDPEAAVEFFIEQGYPPESVIEYLLTIANSNFEDWRKANPAADRFSFPFNPKKMSASGALFDMNKMIDISKNVISVMSAEEVYDRTLAWAESYDKAIFELLSRDRDYGVGIFSIDRGGNKPRKDIAKWSDVKSYTEYFFDETYSEDFAEMPENVSVEDRIAILGEYRKVYDPGDEKQEWFEKIKSLCEPLGFTPNVKEYKKTPELFKGHVGDVSSVIRVAVTSRKNTPDLCSIMALLGKEKTLARIDSCIAKLGGK
ncbi:MAG: glutamate--tRNA ligase [Clostridia bacterium]|nr:glutamate--tRNA ligase [Clostridia bacterium]